MLTIRSVTTLLALLVMSLAFSQTSSSGGSWIDNANWIGGAYPGALTVNPGDDVLDFSTETISVDHYLIVGAFGDRVDMNFANSNEVGSLTVEDNDTLIIYGDIDFANKSMAFNLGNNALLIVLGDATFGNRITISTSGTLVVSGNFGKNGGQGSYTGSGTVYAGSYSGGADDLIPGTVANGGDQQQLIGDLPDDGLSDIEDFINDNGDTPLPVELLYFEAEKSGGGVLLSWATAVEINNGSFTIERSEDGEYFYEAGEVPGHGNSDEVIEYEFEDPFVFAPVVYYRLKQTDFDGKHEYFSTIRVETRIERADRQLFLYPTVVTAGALTLRSSAPFHLKAFTVYTLSGKQNRNLLRDATQENPLTYHAPVASLSAGPYLVTVTTSDGVSTSFKIQVR